MISLLSEAEDDMFMLCWLCCDEDHLHWIVIEDRPDGHCTSNVGLASLFADASASFDDEPEMDSNFYSADASREDRRADLLAAICK